MAFKIIRLSLLHKLVIRTLIIIIINCTIHQELVTSPRKSSAITAALRLFKNSSSVHKIAFSINSTNIKSDLQPYTDRLSNYLAISQRTILTNRSSLNTLQRPMYEQIQNTSLLSPNRTAIQNHKYKKHTCHSWEKDGHFCPDDLKNIILELCYVLKSNQKHPLQCPYKHFLPYNRIEIVIRLLKLEQTNIWLHARRNRTNGFGRYEWTERGYRHGEVIDIHSDNSEDNFDKDCLVVRKGRFTPVKCSERHNLLCVYVYDSTKYCENSYKNEQCISSHLDFKNGMCYCKKETTIPLLSRHDFCDKLAEPRSPFQTQMLKLGFRYHKSPCWFGMEVLGNKARWQSSMDPVKYSHWSKQANCDNPFGALRFVRDSGWSLHQDRFLNCAICEVKPRPRKLRLELRHNFMKDSMVLLVRNPSSVSNVLDSNDIFCYSNSGFNFREGLPIKNDSLGQGQELIQIDIPMIPNHPSHYWCRAFEFPNLNYVDSNTIVTFNRTEGYGHEYSIRLNIKIDSTLDPLENGVHMRSCETVEYFLRTKLENVKYVRPMLALEHKTPDKLVILAHVTTDKGSLDQLSERNKLDKALEELNREELAVKAYDLAMTDVCAPNETMTSDNETLAWPESRVGTTAIPSNKLCLDPNYGMRPVTRKCEGDFMHGANWAEVKGNCPKSVTYKKQTEDLHELLNKNGTAAEIMSDLSSIVEGIVDVQPIDVYLIANVLVKVVESGEEFIEDEFLKTANNLMDLDRSALYESQMLLNSTDMVLSVIDSYLVRQNPKSLKSSKLLARIFDTNANEIVGIALHKNEISTDLNGYQIIPLVNEMIVVYLTQVYKLEAVVLFSQDSLNEITSLIGSKSSIKLIVTVFDNDALFNERGNIEATFKFGGKILGIGIAGFYGYLDSPVTILVKTEADYRTKKCSHWQYGWDEMAVGTLGKWNFNNASKRWANAFEKCEYFHMTHFGLLLQDEMPPKLRKHQNSLKIVTQTGLGLSLVGVIGIFVTAGVYKTWRESTGNKILLQFCVVITVQMILLLLEEELENEGLLCTIMGFGIHYSVLSEFCWMLVIAVLQYRRFVTVLNPLEHNILKKCLLVGWILPLIAPTITVSISAKNYQSNESKFCYPTRDYFFLGILMPIIVILTINAVIFVKILVSVFWKTSETVPIIAKNRSYKKEVLLAFFLFFVLGLAWIFGLLGVVSGDVFFTYVFCMTATIRGFVLFLYFVIGNKNIRRNVLKNMTRRNAVRQDCENVS